MGELPKKRKIYIEEAKVTEAVKNAISLEMDMAEKMKAYLQTEKNATAITERDSAIFRKGVDDISGNGAGRERPYSFI